MDRTPTMQSHESALLHDTLEEEADFANIEFDIRLRLRSQRLRRIRKTMQEDGLEASRPGDMV